MSNPADQSLPHLKQPSKPQSILVWDLPVRIFHWLLVICFAGAWLSSESERLQMIHYAFGYTACFLVIVRLLWGIVGTKYARFSQFLKGPKAIVEHFMAMLRGHTHEDLGHNPAGGLVMLALMLLMLLIGFTGYLTVKETFGDLSSDMHEAVANIALGLVVLHVAAALLMSVLQKQNLVRSMITGKKLGLPEQGIRYPQYLFGILLLASTLYVFILVLTGALPILTQ